MPSSENTIWLFFQLPMNIYYNNLLIAINEPLNITYLLSRVYSPSLYCINPIYPFMRPIRVLFNNIKTHYLLFIYLVNTSHNRLFEVFLLFYLILYKYIMPIAQEIHYSLFIYCMNYHWLIINWSTKYWWCWLILFLLRRTHFLHYNML